MCFSSFTRSQRYSLPQHVFEASVQFYVIFVQVAKELIGAENLSDADQLENKMHTTSVRPLMAQICQCTVRAEDTVYESRNKDNSQSVAFYITDHRDLNSDLLKIKCYLLAVLS